MNNPYSVLGLLEDATDEQIRERYRSLLKEYNEQLNLESPACEMAKEKINQLNNAYDEIMNLRRGGYHQNCHDSCPQCAKETLSGSYAAFAGTR